MEREGHSTTYVVVLPKMFNLSLIKENNETARCQCLMPIILATQEAEIRRIMVKAYCGRIVFPIKLFTKKGWWSGSRWRS
jgi:hypothetical protein